MKVFFNIESVPSSSCVVSVGNFDGVHIGHQALLKKLLEQKKKYKVPSVVISFDPHPVEFFTGKKSRLFSVKDLSLELKKAEVDYLVLLKFDKAFSLLSHTDFLENFLYILKPKAVVVGQDFCFGYKTMGTVSTLQEWSKLKAIDFDVVADVYWKNTKVSSTRLRLCYEKNRWEELEKLLGRVPSSLDQEK